LTKVKHTILSHLQFIIGS